MPDCRVVLAPLEATRDALVEKMEKGLKGGSWDLLPVSLPNVSQHAGSFR